jgi:hypothetical protein
MTMTLVTACRKSKKISRKKFVNRNGNVVPSQREDKCRLQAAEVPFPGPGDVAFKAER